MARQKHNAMGDSGRNCWGSIREKEKRKARLEIRQRVASGALHLDIAVAVDAAVPSADNGVDNSINTVAKAYKPSNRPAPPSFTTEELLQCVRNIQIGHRSRFSIISLSSQIHLMNQRHAIHLLDRAIPYAIMMTRSKHGDAQATLLSNYIQSLSSFTILEYAIWMGKHSIVGAFILGGISVCTRSYHVADDDISLTTTMAAMEQRQREMGVQVMQRLFDWVPLSLSSYILKRVMDFRVEAYAAQAVHRNEGSDDGAGCECKDLHDDSGNSHNCVSNACPICQTANVPMSFRLKMSCCQHTFCEPCFWQHTLRWIDACSSHDDAVTCPICTTASHCDGDDNIRQDSVADERTPQERYQQSYRQYIALPEDRLALKHSSKKKKKAKVNDDKYLTPTWHSAVRASVGLTQEVRRDKFFFHADRVGPSAGRYVSGCLDAGVDVQLRNEYGQTALYMAAWRGDVELMELLLQYGADPAITANGGLSVLELCRRRGDERSIELLRTAMTDKPQHDTCQDPLGSRKWQERLNSESLSHDSMHLPKVTTLISSHSEHPGAGSYICDGGLLEGEIDALVNLWKDLPVETERIKKKKAKASVRSHYCDAEGQVRNILLRVVRGMKQQLFHDDGDGCAAGGNKDHVTSTNTTRSTTRSTNTSTNSTNDEPVVFPHMRILKYAEAGTFLAPHIDLCRNWTVDDNCDATSATSGDALRSTHSFLLYLTDCEDGGETCLLNDVNGAGADEVVASVSPIRGRLLLFPHVCPHRGNVVQDVPKVLIRGEVYLPLEGNTRHLDGKSEHE